MDKNKDKDHGEFDPEEHNEVKKGALKPESKNQYGEKPGGKDRNLSKRVQNESNKDQK